MSEITDLIYDTKRKMLAKYPRFGSEIAVASIEFKDNLPYHTAATDGKNIYVDPNYFASLSENDRLFTIAHEIMHIKFMHMYRLKDENGVKRDLKLWNIATDAIINANLERDGFRVKEGYVNMPEALNYSAEEFYQKLLQEKERREQEQNNNQNCNQEQGDGQEQDNQQESKQSEEQNNQRENRQNQEQENEQDNENAGQTENQSPNEGKSQGDDHSLWEEAFKQRNSPQKEQRQDKNSQKQEDEQEQKQNGDEQTNKDFDEREEFEENRKEKRGKFKSRREKTEKDIRGTEGTIKLENIGKSKEEIDWKVLLRREVEKTETIWSQRRSIAENNYAYRLEGNDIEDEAESEVMIDVSGSVDLRLVKSFLRQLKPLLEQSKLRVGCFNEQFWGFVDIKNEKEIDNFTIPRGARGRSAWTENWDLAVRSFTKKREINKIVFTDGYPCPGIMPKEDLKRENIIWLVYGNKDFKPCCGKVINITERQLEQLHQVDKRSTMDDIER